MKEFDPPIIGYMQEQLPDLIDAYEDAVLCGDSDYSEYMGGIIQAYEHLVEKFSYEPLDKNPES